MSRRLLFVDHVCRILGGAEVNLVELIGHPASRPDWEITVACDPSGPLHLALRDSGATRLPFAFDPALGQLRVVGRGFPLAGALRSLRALRSARRGLGDMIRTIRPDAVVSCTNKDHFAAWPACRSLGIPSVWWVNDILSADFFPWLARQAFLAQARRGATRLLVVSEFARSTLLRQGLDPDRVVTVPNGIPLERYQGHARGTLRRLLDLPDAEPLAGIVGRITPWKGQEFFLRLAEAWSRTRPEGHFALIGHAFNEDQEFERSLRMQVHQLGLDRRVHFVPFQPEVGAALADLDVLVHASTKPEPFGRVLIEAMAAGVPVLAARDGGVPEILTDGVDGRLASPGSLGEYLEALGPLLTDPQVRARLRRGGLETVARRFTLPRVRERFEAVLQGLH